MVDRSYSPCETTNGCFGAFDTDWYKPAQSQSTFILRSATLMEYKRNTVQDIIMRLEDMLEGALEVIENGYRVGQNINKFIIHTITINQVHIHIHIHHHNSQYSRQSTHQILVATS